MPLSMSGNGNLVKAAFFRIIDNKIKDQYAFQFNFSELGANHSADYNLINPPGSMRPTAIFKASPGPEFSISIMIDNSSHYDALGIMPDLAYLESLTLPDVDTYLESDARWIAPDRLTFVVGPRAWDVICLSVHVKETRYKRELIPERATVDIVLRPVYIDQSSIVAYLTDLKTLYSHRVTRPAESPGVTIEEPFVIEAKS